VPATSIDTFFACMIMVTVALISMAFLGNTLEAQINSTKDANKQSYLQAIADHLLTNVGSPSNWGASGVAPSDFGLAAASSTVPYELDLDKVSRLNPLNGNTLSMFQLGESSKLNIALGITISQILSISVTQKENFTVGGQVYCTFTVSTNVQANPTSASLHGYLLADSYLSEATNQSSSSGYGNLSFEVPANMTQDALLVVFARANYDDRVTSYAIYDFNLSSQQSIPDRSVAALTPQNYTLNVSPSVPDVTVEGGFALSFGFQQNLTSTSGSQYRIPALIDHSPFVLVVYGSHDGAFFQQWSAYPQIPLNTGSTFTGSAKNVFNYLVTVKGTLYNMQISLGDVAN